MTRSQIDMFALEMLHASSGDMLGTLAELNLLAQAQQEAARVELADRSTLKHNADWHRATREYE